MSVVSDTISHENYDQMGVSNDKNSPDEFSNDVNIKCNLIINYLPHDIDDNGLRSLFEEFGEIIMTKVVRDKNTKKSLGYGFVKFAQEYSAAVAMERMNGFNVGTKVLKVSIARPPSLDIRNCKLYVTNLPKEYTESEIMALFKEFGEIIECRLLKEPGTKISKGVAFVQFNLKQQANDALSLNGFQLEGSPRPLAVKYAEDQHKKKELSRLHNLTLNTGFRGGPGGMQGGGGPGGMGNHPMNLNHHPGNNMHHHQNNPGLVGGNMNMNMNNMNNNNMKFRDNKNDGQGGLGQGGGGGPLGSPYFYQAQSLANMYNNPQPSPPPPMPMVHSPIGNNRMMFAPPPPNPGTPPGMGGGGMGDFNGRRTPRAPKNKGFAFDNNMQPGLQPAPAVGNWFPPQQLPFMPNAGLPPPPALHHNQSNMQNMAALSPRFYPMRSPQQPGAPDNLNQLFQPGGAPGGAPGMGGQMPPPGMNGPPGMPHPHSGPPGMGAPPGMGPPPSLTPNMAPNMPPGMAQPQLGDRDPYDKLNKRPLYT